MFYCYHHHRRHHHHHHYYYYYHTTTAIASSFADTPGRPTNLTRQLDPDYLTRRLSQFASVRQCVRASACVRAACGAVPDRPGPARPGPDVLLRVQIPTCSFEYKDVWGLVDPPVSSAPS